MNLLLLTPDDLRGLVSAVIAAAMLGALVRLPDKTAASRWLAGVAGAFCALSLAMTLVSSLHPQVYARFAWLGPSSVTPVIAVALPVLGLLVSVGQFAYHLVSDPFPRERRLHLRVVAGGGSVTLALLAYSYPRGLSTLTVVLLLGLIAVLAGGVLCVPLALYRKLRRARRAGRLDEVRVLRPFAWLSAMWTVATLVVGLGGSTLDQAANAAIELLPLAFVCVLFTLFITHVPGRVRFQTKLVGLTLVATLAVLGVAIELASARLVEPIVGRSQVGGLRFSPLPDGGYTVRRVDARVGGPAGDTLRLTDEESRGVAVGFPFPFAGRTWSRVYVHANGAVYFGEAPSFTADGLNVSLGGPSSGREGRYYPAELFYNRRPKIAPLIADLDPEDGGRVEVERAPDRLTVTWRAVQQEGTEGRVTSRVVLERSGAVTFAYGPVALRVLGGNGLLAARGLVTGRQTPLLTAAAVPAGAGIRMIPGASWAEDFHLRAREQVHRDLIGYVWLILGAAAAVLILFPLVYRTALVRPLERLLGGVREVEAGRLATEVPVGARDEVGEVTAGFNTMTGSLRRYADEMEGLVAERTAALEEKSAALAESLSRLHAAQAQLIQQEKLASMGRLTSGIAHEIKNPLNFVNNFSALSQELLGELRAELAPHRDLLNGEVAELLDSLETNALKVNEHGRRADGIVRAMMEHARGGTEERRRVDVNRFVEEQVALALDGRAGGAAAVRRAYGEGVGEAEVAPQPFGRALGHLLANALEAVDERGVGADGAAVTVRTRRDGDRVVIEVQDLGGGVAPEVRGRLFEPFTTTKPPGSGHVGLGLSLSRDVVVGHGGTVEATSEPGVGSTFTVSIPGMV